jgi:NADPH-dependent 2,4-dienoyl-CoA reductase/sulfur reductase-like enzyme
MYLKRSVNHLFRQGEQTYSTRGKIKSIDWKVYGVLVLLANTGIHCVPASSEQGITHFIASRWWAKIHLLWRKNDVVFLVGQKGGRI